MVAVTKLRPASLHRSSVIANSADPFSLFKGSLCAKKVARQSPIVGGLHRAVDGALIGVFIAVALMSGCMLYWQHLWTLAFTRLERTRDLTHRLTESTALLEQHFLQSTSLPKSRVPTKAANLLYLDRPEEINRKKLHSYQKWSIIKDLVSQPAHQGY